MTPDSSPPPQADGPRLLFVENSDEAFIAVARDMIRGGVRRIAFEPLDSRAHTIISALANEATGCQYLVADDGAAADATFLLINDGDVLGSALLRFLDLDRGIVVAPRTDWHFQSRPVFLISIPKAGTHLLYELARAFGYADGVMMGTSGARPGHWYCVEYSNSHTSARDFFIDTVRRSPFGNRAHPFMRCPAIFIYRNPRDILASEANYYHLDGNAPFAGYLEALSPSERLLRLIDDPWLLGNLRDRMGAFVPWLTLPNVIPVSFEELVGPSGGGDEILQRRLIWSLQLKLQIPGDPTAYAGKVFNRASPTFFAGKIGAGNERFSTEVEARFSSLPQDFMDAFGYGRAGDGSIPTYSTRGDEFRRRKVTISKADFSSVPLAVEYDFLGFNLVQFNSRIYALAESLGPVDMATMAAVELTALPNAESVEAVKYLVAALKVPRQPDPAALHKPTGESEPPRRSLLARIANRLTRVIPHFRK